ncbi:hypothetical protein KDA_08400 [Dictyobacter alpinus]|uniref:non-specific serine/threonine protein kinase n=1 Tax=Dictyobacter alpinus TaxID=2014873 RepID=A0A402B1X4_9CHLR|nr:serine/threonine-protein kinase [Dictyobacter alpinus]GCE25356.1 hypothetical protein KDA_08400 [Dictyobacter alpinus]
MESNDLLIGKQLGTCVLDRLVGSGGMGMVYLAHQTRPVRDVAVKVLRSGAGIYTEAHQEFLERFRREANVIARLDHVNILPIYEYAEQDGLAYLVMPYLQGGSLRSLLEDKGRLSPLEAFKYIEQAGSALQYAHEHKIVHRDIKPGNMLFHADGRLVLVDFGIARITRDQKVSDLSDPSLTAVGQFLGSADYMAPEMVQGGKVDYRADIYELGVVLFQMLIGRVPFQGGSPLFIAAMHLNEQPPSLTQLDPNIPYSVDAVVQKALAKDPAARYQSAREMVDALRLALGISTSLTQASFPGANAYTLNPASVPGNSYPQNMGYPVSNSLPPPPIEVSQRLIQAQYIQPGSMSGPHTSSPSNMAQGYPAPQAYPSSWPQHMAPEVDTAFVPYPHQVQQSKRRSSAWVGWLLTIFVVLALVVVGLIFGPHLVESAFVHPATPTAVVEQPTATTPPAPTATPVSTATTTPAVLDVNGAKAFVQSYYDDINQSNYQGAYTHWNKEYQNANSPDTFAAGFKQTKQDDVTFNSISKGDDQSYNVNVSVVATEVDDNGNTIYKHYKGTYVVGKDADGLHFLPASRMLPV